MKKFFLVIILIFFPSCRKSNTEVDANQQWYSKHLEAKLYDIPILVSASVIHDDTACLDENTSIISYYVPLHENAFTFYQEEMERLGWWQITTFKGSESLLNFEKPNKYCSIFLRSSKKNIHIIIFVGQKDL